MIRTFFYIYRGRKIFRDPLPADSRFADAMEWPLPKARYVMFFTPRSGSSHLGSLISKTGQMGDPREVFNPVRAHAFASALGASSLDDYIARLLRTRNRGGLFGAQVTWPHLLSAFRTAARFEKLLALDHYIWLTRRDIVAQAVSVTAMKQTQISQTNMASDAAIAQAREDVTYNPQAIRCVMRRLAWMEAQTEAFFEKMSISPLRLVYENYISAPPNAVLTQIAEHLDVVLNSEAELESGYKRLSGEKNKLFAERFRAEHKDFVARIERSRRKSDR